MGRWSLVVLAVLSFRHPEGALPLTESFVRVLTKDLGESHNRTRTPDTRLMIKIHLNKLATSLRNVAVHQMLNILA